MSFAGVLLAGGRSKRMKQDKAFLPWQGRPLWIHQAALLESAGPDEVCICGRREQTFEGLEPEWRFLSDPVVDDFSPMEAIAQAMSEYQKHLLVLAVDLPQMKLEILQALVSHLQKTGKGAAYRIDEGWEPLCAVYPWEMKELMEDFVAGSNLRLQTLLQEAARLGCMDALPLPEDWRPLFLNTNTPEEWKQMQPPKPS